jgi:hypothetical protein
MISIPIPHPIHPLTTKKAQSSKLKGIKHLTKKYTKHAREIFSKE